MRISLLFFFSFSFCISGKLKFLEMEVSSNNLYSHTLMLSSNIGERNFRNKVNYDKSKNYIIKQFKGIGLKSRFQSYSKETFHNVIATINEPFNEIIVIGAHYDTCGNQSGADDNASGVAGLIELSRICNKYKSSIPYKLIFVAYANEEPPFFRTMEMGSFIHARSLKSKKVKVKLMISLEMIGYFTEKENTQSYPSKLLNPFYPSRGNFIAAVSKWGQGKHLDIVKKVFNKRNLINCETLSAPSLLQGIDFSDHLNYWHFGFDAIMITDTAFYRNNNYHKITDTIETLDFLKMSFVVDGLLQFLINY